MDERWVTIGGEDNNGSGQHVLIKENGTIMAGFGKGRNVKNAFGGSQKSSGNKHEAKAREAVEYWLKTHYKEENDKNIKASVESVRSQMEHRLKSAEKNLRDAKKLGKPEIEKKFQEKYDEAKGELDALNRYYDGGTVRNTFNNLKEAGKIRPLDERKDLVPRHIAKAYKAIDKKRKEYNDERKALIKESKDRLDKILKTEGEGDAFYKAYKEEKRKLYNLDRKYDREAGKLEKESGFTQWSTTPNHKVQFNTKTGNAHVKMKKRTISLKK